MLSIASLYICHGGMCGTREALYCGVPMIVIPLISDQFTVADAVVASKVGLMLDINQISIEQLRETVCEIFSNSTYSAAMSTISNKSLDCGGEASAVELIKKIID